MESICIRVPRVAGERIRQRLIELGVLNKNLRIKTCGDDLLIPITNIVAGLGEPGKENFEIVEYETPLPKVKGAYEIIGDIAIIDQHEENTYEIGNTLLKHKNIKTVFQAISAVSGEYRTRELLFISGDKKTETLYRENGCRYHLDVAQVYFTPRLSTERMRIAEQIKEGELVIDMFAGIGPFSILIAKKYPESQVIAIDKNPIAIKYLRENMRLNKIKNIEIREGDAKDEVRDIVDADHVIMNLPHSGLEFLDASFGIIKKGGIIHLYAISHEEDLFNGKSQAIEDYANRADRSVTYINKRIVRPYAPYQFNICIDFQVK